MNENQKLNEMLKWVEIIKNFSITLLDNREMYHRYVEIVKANPDIQYPLSWHWWILKNYGDAIAMRIRGQLDAKGITLMGLLELIKKNPDAITREWHATTYTPLQLAEGLEINFAGADFDKYAGRGAIFDKAIAEQDIAKLKQLGTNTESYVNKRLAHFVAHAKINDVTFNELDAFIDEFESIAKRYVVLLTGSHYEQFAPIPQYDQDIVFTKPWIKRGE